MASNKLFSTILMLSLLSYSSTLTNACGTCNPVKPTPTPSKQKCPNDTLKLGVCANVLGLVNVVVGSPASSKCCALLQGLTDLEAAICLCTAIKANVLGINLNVPISLTLLLSACQKSVPSGFQCAA
ncbi:hypothetical protein Lal_00044648 [Lupinus albus]|uniref:Putative bifunctional inhibitor/plant lipid transfer protein/seed storage helical n=1 Tax=Lupinus albus TaxID=3870 RepID=A0A6A4NIC5_LUPAL|nr:putative bifunctional inhibitor/plant lipid transfer protein/seed storage helical [Lupinus albus]KAF1858615.1 hypothetical protein Lal_00044648 [Lupinus albus]